MPRMSGQQHQAGPAAGDGHGVVRREAVAVRGGEHDGRRGRPPRWTGAAAGGRWSLEKHMRAVCSPRRTGARPETGRRAPGPADRAGLHAASARSPGPAAAPGRAAARPAARRPGRAAAAGRRPSRSGVDALAVELGGAVDDEVLARARRRCPSAARRRARPARRRRRVIRRRVRCRGSIVVSASWSASISPRPL